MIMNNKQINKELMIEINKILKNKKIKKISEKEHKQINKELMIEIKKILNNKKMKGGDEQYLFQEGDTDSKKKCDSLFDSEPFTQFINNNYSKKPNYTIIKNEINNYKNSTTKYTSECLNRINNILNTEAKITGRNRNNNLKNLKTAIDNEGLVYLNDGINDDVTEGEKYVSEDYDKEKYKTINLNNINQKINDYNDNIKGIIIDRNNHNYKSNSDYYKYNYNNSKELLDNIVGEIYNHNTQYNTSYVLKTTDDIICSSLLNNKILNNKCYEYKKIKSL